MWARAWGRGGRAWGWTLEVGRAVDVAEGARERARSRARQSARGEPRGRGVMGSASGRWTCRAIRRVCWRCGSRGWRSLTRRTSSAPTALAHHRACARATACACARVHANSSRAETGARRIRAQVAGWARSRSRLGRLSRFRSGLDRRELARLVQRVSSRERPARATPNGKS